MVMSNHLYFSVSKIIESLAKYSLGMMNQKVYSKIKQQLFKSMQIPAHCLSVHLPINVQQQYLYYLRLNAEDLNSQD